MVVKVSLCCVSTTSIADDVCFYAGASVWTTGQLQREVESGIWLPCTGPAQIALRGMCEHEETQSSNDEARPRADLWLSMMCAMGQEEGNLAHLVVDDNGSEYSDACDA